MKHTLVDQLTAPKALAQSNNLKAAILNGEPKGYLAKSSDVSTKALSDNLGRTFPYLRLSLTDLCNFKCNYCLPDGYVKEGKQSFLSLVEIENLLAAFADLGMDKLRLTGGEPTLRQDFDEILAIAAQNKAIKKLSMTSNGYKLKENIHKWLDMGLNGLNISMDSLNAEKFAKLTGHDRHAEIIDGIDQALQYGLPEVKINAVLLKGINDDEIFNFAEWVKDKPISVRFIELMQTGDNQSYFNKHHLSAEPYFNKMKALGWSEVKRAYNDGPARVFKHQDYVGSIGFIAPYSKDFCLNCNRLRITAKGDLRLCLFGEQGISIRHLLQHADQKQELIERITQQLSFKASSHFLHDGLTGDTLNLSKTGG